MKVICENQHLCQVRFEVLTLDKTSSGQFDLNYRRCIHSKEHEHNESCDKPCEWKLPYSNRECQAGCIPIKLYKERTCFIKKEEMIM